MLKLAYTFFMGLLLSVFVGLGIATFYEAPPAPQEPNIVRYKDSPLAPAELAAENAFAQQSRLHEEKMKTYNKNVALYALLAAVVFVAIGILFENKINGLADGVMLGGVFTLVYSLGRSFASQNNKLSFALVSLALVATSSLGYWRFARAPKPVPGGGVG